MISAFYYKVIDFVIQKITCYYSSVVSHLYSYQPISSDMQLEIETESVIFIFSALVEELHKFQGYQATYAPLKWTFTLFKVQVCL